MRTSAIMLLSLLVIAALCVSASAAIETVTCPQPGPINIGWNLISVPAIPTNPAPPDVFADYGADAIENNLYRWDAAAQGIYLYSMWTPEDFGNILLTDGYWLNLGEAGANQLSFEAITDNDDTDMWISLPKTGWTIIGCPFSYPVDWNTVEVTDGTATVPLANVRDQWLHTYTYWWDSTVPGGGLRTMGLDDDWTDTVMLEPWHGFWVQSLVDNLALIVPAAT